MKEEGELDMNAWDKRMKKIYLALGDDLSRSIFKRRLLFSLTGDKDEIWQMVCESFPNAGRLREKKFCFYGAGAGAGWLLRCMRRDIFVIDKFRTGEIEGHPIVSLEEFLQREDCKEYEIFVTVGKAELCREIAKELESYGLSFQFIYSSRQYFEPENQYFDLENQYFDLGDQYFVDVGALDGETTRHFLNHCPKGHSCVFEPNPVSYDLARKRLEGHGNVEFFPYGCYDRNGKLHFSLCDSDAGSAAVSETGEIEVEVRRLDDVLKGRKATFLKMDIEGSELAALRGAERIIRKQKPRLAICVYHKPEDIWEIPELILDYVSEYKLYLRHYSITYTETVLYAIYEGESNA